MEQHDTISDVHSDDEECSDFNMSSIINSQENHEESIKKSRALFILKTVEVRKLTLTAVNSILGDIQHLVEDALTVAQRKTERVLESHGIDASNIPRFDTSFTSEMWPFAGIETGYLQMKYFRETLGLIVSLCFNIHTYRSLVTLLWVLLCSLIHLD